MQSKLYRDENTFKDILSKMKYSYLRVSLTRDCNANCKFCHNEGQSKGLRGDDTFLQPASLSEDKYRYISKFFKNSFPKVLFTGGEPTTISNLPQIIKIFKEDGYLTKITTNGFDLDPSLQLRLKNAGLDEINISLHSLDEKEHSDFFRVSNALPKVLKNISFIPHTFPDTAKINFMAIEGENVPNQLVAISELSAKHKIPISFLTLVSNNDKNLLSDKVLEHLSETLGRPKLETKNGKFSNKSFYTFENGAIWEFDDFREDSYREEALNNEYCSECDNSNKCVEGPYALRVLYDGQIKPCLIRKDNTLKLSPSGYSFLVDRDR